MRQGALEHHHLSLFGLEEKLFHPSMEISISSRLMIGHDAQPGCAAEACIFAPSQGIGALKSPMTQTNLDYKNLTVTK